MTSLELIKWAEERHVYYCILGNKLLQIFGKCFNPPGFSLFARNTRVAAYARYKKGVCDYNLAYLISMEKRFERTIAHEVAHFVTHQLDYQAKDHGDLFKFVLNEFIGVRNKYHNYTKTLTDVNKAKAIIKIRDLNLQMLKDAAEIEESNVKE